jgi:hypothetical protein
MKTSLANDFDSLKEFGDEELKQWLVTFVNNNEDHFSVIDQVQLECKEVEEDIFTLRVKQEITIGPIKGYIDDWVKKAMEQIVNPE